MSTLQYLTIELIKCVECWYLSLLICIMLIVAHVIKHTLSSHITNRWASIHVGLNCWFVSSSADAWKVWMLGLTACSIVSLDRILIKIWVCKTFRTFKRVTYSNLISSSESGHSWLYFVQSVRFLWSISTWCRSIVLGLSSRFGMTFNYLLFKIALTLFRSSTKLFLILSYAHLTRLLVYFRHQCFTIFIKLNSIIQLQHWWWWRLQGSDWLDVIIFSGWLSGIH